MFSYEVVASFNDLENAIYTTILENEQSYETSRQTHEEHLVFR